LLLAAVIYFSIYLIYYIYDNVYLNGCQPGILKKTEVIAKVVPQPEVSKEL